jgi:hypothetical protein
MCTRTKYVIKIQYENRYIYKESSLKLYVLIREMVQKLPVLIKPGTSLSLLQKPVTEPYSETL